MVECFESISGIVIVIEEVIVIFMVGRKKLSRN